MSGGSYATVIKQFYSFYLNTFIKHPYGARPSAAMVLTMHNKQVHVFHAEGLG